MVACVRGFLKGLVNSCEEHRKEHSVQGRRFFLSNIALLERKLCYTDSRHRAAIKISALSSLLFSSYYIVRFLAPLSSLFALSSSLSSLVSSFSFARCLFSLCLQRVTSLCVIWACWVVSAVDVFWGVLCHEPIAHPCSTKAALFCKHEGGTCTLSAIFKQMWMSNGNRRESWPTKISRGLVGSAVQQLKEYDE